MAIQQTRQALAPSREQYAEIGSGTARRGRQYEHRHRRNGSQDKSAEWIANGLGWFSIGLGLAEVLAPKSFAKLIGAEGKHSGLIRFMGIREITAGIGILTQNKPAEWVWARVAGDALDLACLGAAFTSPKSDPGRLAIATAAVIGVAALDIYDAQRLSSHGKDNRTIRVITINRSPEEVYQFWRDFQNLPRFMSHLESVHVIDEKRSRWVAKAPAGTSVEWDAEIIEDRPNQLIAWRSLEGADVDNAGTVSFNPAPGGRGTEVSVELEYNPPGGALGAGIAKLFGEAPEQQIKGDLYRFKQVMETGEVVHSDASIHSGMHPAKPAERRSDEG